MDTDQLDRDAPPAVPGTTRNLCVVRRVLTVLVCAVVMLAGCSKPPPGPPEVTFATDGTTVPARPFLYCDVMVTSCERNEGAVASLAVPPGKPVTISVPGEVAESPWSVVVQYRAGNGEQREPETVATFVPGERHDYTVRLDDAAAQLQTVEVKQAGAKQEPGATSEIQLLARGVWSLRVQTAQ